MTEPRIISYTMDNDGERVSLRHLAMLHVDRLTEKRIPTADVVMPFYGSTADEARSAAETWLSDQQRAVEQKAANIEAGQVKRADARKAKVPA